jgi:hypothetical protein
MKLQLSIGVASNPRTWPVLDGRIKADGYDLIPSMVHPSELFWRVFYPVILLIFGLGI